MDNFIIKGPTTLKGTVAVSSSKNATLPIMAALLLSPAPITLEYLPKLRDINTMKKLLENLGMKTEVVDEKNNHLSFDASSIKSHEATYELVKTMRASILVLGPLLARFKKASVSLPGGCAIGDRPIDLHLKGLKAMGATIEIEAGYVHASVAEEGLIGTEIALDFPSVGATENIMMAAVLARGKTVIDNAAREPEIQDLACFLREMGATISGEGTSTIEIEGMSIEKMRSFSYRPIPDRIEAMTLIIAALMTKSDVIVENIRSDHMSSFFQLLKEMKAKFDVDEEKRIAHLYKSNDLHSVKVDTAPYPGFPTDAQAQLMSLLTQVKGASVVTENIFENRFMHVSELKRMNADITLKGSAAFVMGDTKLQGAPVMCTDLRASAALVLAALVAEGETTVERIYHLDRGYEQLEKKLSALGANIKRVREV